MTFFLCFFLICSLALNVTMCLREKQVGEFIAEFRRRGRLNKMLYAELQATTAELEQHRKTEA